MLQELIDGFTQGSNITSTKNNYKKMVYFMFSCILDKWEGANTLQILNAVISICGVVPKDDVDWFTKCFMKHIGGVFKEEPVEGFQFSNEGIFAEFFQGWF